MYWLIQSTGLRDTADNRILDGLKGADTQFVDFGVVPFTTEITGWQNFRVDQPVFVHCSTRALSILIDDTIPAEQIFVGAAHPKVIREHMLSGIFYHRLKFDQSVYRFWTPIAPHLLNGGTATMYVSLGSIKHEVFETDYFMKPAKDLKLFKGQVVPAGRSLKEVVEEGTVDVAWTRPEADSEVVIVAPVKNVIREYRFFVVGKAVAAYSQYMVKGHVKYDADVPQWVIDKANELAPLFQPAHAYTMDLGLTDDLELKIVEYNCINCSGLYHADITNLAIYLRHVNRSKELFS